MLYGDSTAMWPKSKRIAAEPAPRPADLCDQAFAIGGRLLAYLIFQDDALFLGFGRESAGLGVESFYWGNIQSPLRPAVVEEITLSRKRKIPKQHSIAARKATKFNQNTAQNNGPSPHPNTPRRLCKRMIEPSATLKAQCNRKILNA